MEKNVYLFAGIGLFAIIFHFKSENLQSSALGASTNAKNVTNDKVTLCHKPDGTNPHQITISVNALPAHLAHGDTIGSCDGGGDNPVP